ncbi:serine hydrolase [Paenibacillus daejeonensis]|uniref:serine hydrolase n=1 Tax=Paenibacillus daejeonensis TaxID=135193 RepID=UPI000373BDDC|nr:serine hydrolase [Paenibacillus daejeonensis]
MKRKYKLPVLKVALAVALAVTACLPSAMNLNTANAAEPEGWQDLRGIVQPIINAAEEQGVRVSVNIQDLSGTFGNQRLSLGSTESYMPASTIKLALATALMQQVDKGDLSLTDEVEVSPSDVVGGTGSLQKETFPQQVTLERLARLMITQSDNTATNVLIDVVGLDTVQQLMDELGLTVMHLGRKMFAPAPTPEQDNYIDASDLTTLLEEVYQGDVLSEASSEQLITWMSEQEVDTKFGSALPQAPIAHKTGENANVTHDAGYFLVPGRELAISVLTQVTTTTEFSEAQAIGNPIVQRIAKAVYNYQRDHSTESVSPLHLPQFVRSVEPLIQDASERGIRVSVAIKDLSGSYGYKELHLGSRQPYMPASTIKLALATALMQQVDKGELSLSNEVEVSPSDVVGGTGSLQKETFPQQVTLERLARLIITQSDNTATNVLIDVVGLDTVQQLMDELGLTVMHLGRKMFAPAPTPEQDNYINAADLTTLLEEIYQGDVLSEASSEQLITWMSEQEVDTKFGSALPQAPIAHKTGENANVTHDAGYFLVPGRELAISVLTEVTTTSTFSEAQAIGNPIVQDIARTVYGILTYELTYSDVPDSHWAAASIREAAVAGLTEGMPDGRFEPESQVTRGHYAALLARALQLHATGDPVFADVEADSWYAGAIAAVHDAGIVSGDAGDAFQPEALLTRAELAVMTLRAYEYAGGALPVGAAEAAFADESQIPLWALTSVQQARELGLLKGYPDGRFLPNGTASRAEVVKVITSLWDL